MNPKKSPEINNWYDIEIWKIRVWDVEQNSLTPEQTKRFEKILLTREQAEKLKNGEFTIQELTRLESEQLRSEIESQKSIKDNLLDLFEAQNKWKWEAIESQEQANWLLDSLNWLSSINKTQISEKTTQVKEKAKSLWLWAQLWKVIKEAWEKLSKWDILWAIAAFFKWLFSMFSWKLLKEEIKEWLSSDQKAEVKIKVREKLVESFPWKEERIDSLISSWIIKEEWLEKLFKVIKAKGWKINLVDIQESLWVSLDSILTEEELKLAKDRWVFLITKYIEETYNVSFNLEPTKRKKLRQLVKENLKIDKTAIHRMKEEEQWRIRDISPLIIESGTNLVGFSIWLVSAWIISWSDIAIDFANNFWDSLMMWIELFPFTDTITIDDFIEKTKGMSDEERMLIFQIAARKSALLWSILWKVSYYWTWLITDLITNTSAWWAKLSSQIIAWDIEWQIESFNKLEKELVKTSEISDDLRSAYKNFSSLRENTLIIKWLNDPKTVSVEDILNNKNIPDRFKQWLEWITDINVAREQIAWKMTYIDSNWTKKTYQHLPWWINKEIQTLQRKVWSIVELQKNIAKWDLAVINRLQSAFEWVNLSRTVDNLVFEWLNKQQAIDKMQALRKIANDSPEMFRNILSAWWTIWFVWLSLALSNDESFADAMWNEFLLLTRLIWPASLVLDFWVNWEKIQSWDIDTIWAAWAWVWITLFTMDAIWIATIMTTTPWIANKFAETGKFLVKPITDVVSAGSSLLQQARNIRKLSIARWTINLWIKNVIKWAVEAWKSIKNPRVAIPVTIWLAAFGIIKYYGNERDENIEVLVEKWVYSEEWQFNLENTRNVFNQLSIEQQKIAVKSWIQSQLDFDISDISFDIIDWEIKASSNIEGDIREYFLYSIKNKQILHDLLWVDKFTFIS